MEGCGTSSTAAALFEQLAEVLNLVEETGAWPVPITRGLISLSPKGEGSTLKQLRPIGLTASVYKLWASIRDTIVLTAHTGAIESTHWSVLNVHTAM